MTTDEAARVRAALFDLDGVLVSTDRFHYEAWKKLASEEGIYFDLEINHRLRGVSRMQSLEIILERACRQYSYEEKKALCERKNEYFKEYIQTLTPDDWFPGVRELLTDLRAGGLRLALCSSSRNAKSILERLDGSQYFDAIVDGFMINKTKPDPEIFLLAAEKLKVNPADCVVFEDAPSGIEAAKQAGMRCVGIGLSEPPNKADLSVRNTAEIEASVILEIIPKPGRV